MKKPQSNEQKSGPVPNRESPRRGSLGKLALVRGLPHGRRTRGDAPKVSSEVAPGLPREGGARSH